jgi:hypothetical protein
MHSYPDPLPDAVTLPVRHPELLCDRRVNAGPYSAYTVLGWHSLVGRTLSKGNLLPESAPAFYAKFWKELL